MHDIPRICPLMTSIEQLCKRSYQYRHRYVRYVQSIASNIHFATCCDHYTKCNYYNEILHQTIAVWAVQIHHQKFYIFWQIVPKFSFLISKRIKPSLVLCTTDKNLNWYLMRFSNNIFPSKLLCDFSSKIRLVYVILSEFWIMAYWQKHTCICNGFTLIYM